MDHHLQQQRRAAADAFLESLDQMSLCFQPDAGEPADAEPATPAVADPTHAAEPFDLDALEAAIADIEQFMQQRQS
jgi:hypothetical protein